MSKIKFKGWSKPNQYPSESCLPNYLYYSSAFRSVELIKLIRETGFSLNESKSAVEGIMSGQDFVIEIESVEAAQIFGEKAESYGADVVMES